MERRWQIMFLVVIIQVSNDVVFAADECYQCSTTDASCVTSPTNVVQCDSDVNDTMSCVTEAQIDTASGVTSLFTFSRGCSTSSDNCCESVGTGAGRVKCTSTCSNSSCNSEPYNAAEIINTLPRCTYTGNVTHQWCNLCLTSASQDLNCIHNPDSAFVNQVLCNMETHYCTVQHQVYTNDPSQIYSYARDCLPKTTAGFGRTDDYQFNTWLCYCNWDYCNDNTEMGNTAECHPDVTTAAVRVSSSAVFITNVDISTLTLLLCCSVYNLRDRIHPVPSFIHNAV